jgi:hypothetical protein
MSEAMPGDSVSALPLRRLRARPPAARAEAAMKAAPLAIPGVEVDAIDWCRVAPRVWEHRRGRAETCRIEGPRPLGVRVGYKSRARRLRPMVWQWSALLRGLQTRGGGGCASSLKSAKEKAEAEMRRARDEEARWRAYLSTRKAAAQIPNTAEA